VAPSKVRESYHIEFEDRTLRADLQGKARAAYHAFGGDFQPPAAPSPAAEDEAGLRRFMRVDAAVVETMKRAGL